MKLSSNVLKWMMRFYPPFFFQGIWVKHISKDFQAIEVRIFKCPFNVNFNGSIFGGTIFSAADPMYSIMFWQILKQKGIDTKGWLKSANIQYIKPGNTTLTFYFRLTDEDVNLAIYTLNNVGKFVHIYQSEAFNKEDVLCATFTAEVWMRKQ